MIETIYIEENILQHPRVDDIVARFPQAGIITCGRYGEVFNSKAQNFRLQKQKPALILAEKYKHFALEVHSGYGIGAKRNCYFSHMLYCLYDCRYCFLQGMYQSTNYVLFVNYEAFQDEIRHLCADSPSEGMISYQSELEQEMMHYCTEQLLLYIPEAKFFPCTL